MKSIKIKFEFLITCYMYICVFSHCIRNRGYLLFSVKDQNLFHRVDTIGNIFTSGAATTENITDGVHEMK